MGGRILVDKKGNFREYLVWILVDKMDDFSWTFVGNFGVNFSGHFLNSTIKMSHKLT